MARSLVNKARRRGAPLGGPRSEGGVKTLQRSVRGSGSDGSPPCAPQHAGGAGSPPLPYLAQSGRPEAREPCTGGAGKWGQAEEGSPHPLPAAAAKQRAVCRGSTRGREAEARQARESIAGLAEAAEAEQERQAAAAAAGEGSSHHSEQDAEQEAKQEEDEEAEEEKEGKEAGVLIASGPDFKLARGHNPHCFRIWLKLPPPVAAADISVRCARRYIAVTQRRPGAQPSPDGICLPPPAPLRCHHVVLPEALDLQRPPYCIISPQGLLYIEAAIRRRGGS